MELRHLETFEAILASGTLRGAARALHYSQSSVTLHLQQLEEALGAPLLVRARRRVELTEAGELLAARSRAILDSVRALRRSVAELASGEGGRVVLGAIEPAASARMAPLLGRFCRGRPSLCVRMEVGGSGSIARGVAEGDLDLGLASPPAASRRLAFTPLFREPMALLAPRRHRLALRARVLARDLDGAPLLLTEQGCAYRETIERALAERGVTPARTIGIGSTLGLQQAVAAGLGVALVPVAAPPPPASTRLVRVADLDLSLPVGILRRAEGPPPSAAVAALLDALLALSGPLPGRKAHRERGRG